MKIAKEFTWEMGHRLSFHSGKCKNLHGHSYKCLVELSGTPNSEGMVLDYYDLKKIIEPILDELDHAFMVYKNDTELIDMLNKLNSRIVVVEFETTAENICLFLLEKLKFAGLPKNIHAVKMRVMETENSYAEEGIKLS